MHHLLSECRLAFNPQAFAQARRTYALSRFPVRSTGTARTRQTTSKRNEPTPRYRSPDSANENEAADNARPWHAAQHPPASDPEEGLHALLMGHKALVVERQIEMLNVFVGFEQRNKYIINSVVGDTVGYIAEEESGFLATVSRQVFATHRPFKAVVMDAAGSPILWIRRPFAWINSRMYVQRLHNSDKNSLASGPALDTFGEVQQIWHPWRRRYDAFLREKHRRVLSITHEAQPDRQQSEPSIYKQFAKVDSGFLAWDFPLFDHTGRDIGFISRAFRGFGREIFTDTGQYTVGFTPSEQLSLNGDPHAILRDLSLDERAVILALAVNVDFDYFSRHSGSGGLFHFHTWE
ncbi:hypothetical protein APHAL10511_001281 [Amanita phalloides]|nr:hypothetical protein APHAL10511_001281 [Amanita phalloides]